MENYDITKADLQAALTFWRGVLADEGSEPNEGTIEKVLQLEKQLSDIKQAERHKKSRKHAQQATIKAEPPPQPPFLHVPELETDTVFCLVLFGIGVFILTRRPAAQPRYSSNTTPTTRLQIVGNIELGETANTSEPGRIKR